MVYAIVRQAYLIGVLRLTIGGTPGDEEIVGMFGKKGDGDGGFVWPAGSPWARTTTSTSPTSG